MNSRRQNSRRPLVNRFRLAVTIATQTANINNIIPYLLRPRQNFNYTYYSPSPSPDSPSQLLEVCDSKINARTITHLGVHLISTFCTAACIVFTSNKFRNFAVDVINHQLFDGFRIKAQYYCSSRCDYQAVLDKPLSVLPFLSCLSLPAGGDVS